MKYVVDLLRPMACVGNFDNIMIAKTWMDMAGKNIIPEYKIQGCISQRQQRREGATLPLSLRAR